MKKSWELGVTQSWNKIDPAEEARIDEAAMGGEQEEEEDVGDEKKEVVTQDDAKTKPVKSFFEATTGQTPSERAIQMREQSEQV